MSVAELPAVGLKPYYQDDAVTLYHGDNLDVMAQLEPESFVSIVTDPPYGLAFMGKRWDYEVPSVATWQAALRLLKPGGHLLAFAGTRTQHRMAVNIEDAGFDIRDMIAWVYGSGFPKSLDVSKAIDKAAGAEREVVGTTTHPDGKPRSLVSRDNGVHEGGQRLNGVGLDITAPATDAARQWSGYGSALKPALEPITMARKPLDGTLAANTLKHGCGGINVDGCRVGTDRITGTRGAGGQQGKYSPIGAGSYDYTGRWPANLVHDGSDEVVGLFPSPHGAGSATDGTHCGGKKEGYRKESGAFQYGGAAPRFGDSGSAARFFYCAKASDREILAAESHPLFGESFDAVKNNHPTVKPLALMQWLIRLVTPPGGILLEPFAGSGTTLLAAKAEGRRAVGIEMEERYCEIAANRLSQGVLF
jgi:site-specific DNA-methyltransferase (adenine-specific)